MGQDKERVKVGQLLASTHPKAPPSRPSARLPSATPVAPFHPPPSLFTYPSRVLLDGSRNQIPPFESNFQLPTTREGGEEVCT